MSEAMEERQGWGNRLVEAHSTLRRLLADASSAAAHAELEPAAVLAAQVRAHCESVCVYLHGHHTAEDDLFFPYLLRTNPELADDVARLRRDHALVAGLLTSLEQLGHPADGVADLRDRLARLTALLHDHFQFEEQRLVPALNALRGPVPWDPDPSSAEGR